VERALQRRCFGRGAVKKRTATLLGPGEPGEAWGATSAAVPEELTAVRARRGQTTETRTRRGPDEADLLFQRESMLGFRSVRKLLAVQAEIGQGVALSRTCPPCQVGSPRCVGPGKVVGL
jgi:hypothetical protein